mmetsp:Transcript_31914/g.58030  ORF Transcript_31914/g.58030 Transcript_31914/m.58030 type:complete len:231 (-) Transcript_31914:671-1363(-)
MNEITVAVFPSPISSASTPDKPRRLRAASQWRAWHWCGRKSHSSPLGSRSVGALCLSFGLDSSIPSSPLFAFSPFSLVPSAKGRGSFISWAARAFHSAVEEEVDEDADEETEVEAALEALLRPEQIASFFCFFVFDCSFEPCSKPSPSPLSSSAVFVNSSPSPSFSLPSLSSSSPLAKGSATSTREALLLDPELLLASGSMDDAFLLFGFLNPGAWIRIRFMMSAKEASV